MKKPLVFSVICLFALPMMGSVVLVDKGHDRRTILNSIQRGQSSGPQLWEGGNVVNDSCWTVDQPRIGIAAVREAYNKNSLRKVNLNTPSQIKTAKRHSSIKKRFTI